MKISVITACLNGAEHLRDCIESVAGQAGAIQHEHWIIDGGSTDASVQILQTKASQDPRLHWISESDAGIAEAMNKGIDRCQGEWLLFLHADDYLRTPAAWEKVSPVLDTGAGIVATPVKVFSPNGDSRRFQASDWRFKTRFKTTIPHQGAFIHRSLFDRLGPYDTQWRIGMDYEWFLRAFRHKIPITLYPEAVVGMRDTGVSSRRDWISLRQRFAEERAIHAHFASSPAERMLYRFWWTFYPSYRRIRYTLQPATRR